MQFTTIALTFVAAAAAINPQAKDAFVANYIANAKRQMNATASAAAGNGTGAATGAAAAKSSGAAAGSAAGAVQAGGASTLPSSTSDATVMALSGSALLAGVVALVL